MTKVSSSGQFSAKLTELSTELCEGLSEGNQGQRTRIIEIDNEGNVTVMVKIDASNAELPVEKNLENLGNEDVIDASNAELPVEKNLENVGNEDVKDDGEKTCTTTKTPKVKHRRLLCPLCKKKGVVSAFKTDASLSIHVQKVHIAEERVEVNVEAKPMYQCSLCAEIGLRDVNFDSKSKYQNHLVIQHHTYIFICGICSESFKLKANYKAHLQTHNVPTVKPFKCDVCGGRFVNRAGFQAHCRRFPGPHIKHTCLRCGISFSKPSHITNHRCKYLLLEQAQKRPTNAAHQKPGVIFRDDVEKIAHSPVTVEFDSTVSTLKNVTAEGEVDRATESRVAGQLLQIGVTPTQQIYQVNVADWNVVAPYVIRENHVNVTFHPSSAIYSQPP